MFSKVKLGISCITLLLLPACGQGNRTQANSETKNFFGPSLVEKIMNGNKGKTIIGQNQYKQPCAFYISNIDDSGLVFSFSETSAEIKAGNYDPMSGISAQNFKKSAANRISYNYGPSGMECLYLGKCATFRLDLIVDSDNKINEVREVLSSDHDQLIYSCKIEGAGVLGS